MTTQHTHHEHNDVDQSVVEYPSASESTTAGSTNTSPEVQDEIHTPSPETAHPDAEQVKADTDSQTEQADPATSSEGSASSNQPMMQIQDPSQLSVHAEMIDHVTSVSDTQTMPEVSLSNSTETQEDVTSHTEAESTPLTTPDEVQLLHNEADNVESVEAETQQPAQTINDMPIELEGDNLNSPEVEQEIPAATVVATITFQPPEQEESTELASVVDLNQGQEQATIPTDEQDKTQTTTYEGKSEDAEPHTHTDGADTEEVSANPETQPSEVSLPAEAQTSTDVENTSIPTATAPQLEQHFPYTEIAPLINAKAEEVRPFTEFIEEFRIAEAARLQSTLRESQVETFALLNSVKDPSGEAPINLENVEGTEKTEGTYMQAEANQPTNTELKDTAATEQKTIIDPASRPVSPLLRPATRLRVPRHGLTRHQREEQQANEIAALSAQKTQPEVKEVDATATPPSETVIPKPGRRYRFDRPASTTANAKNSSASITSPTTSSIPGLNGSSPAAPAKGISTAGEETREARTSGIARPELAIPVPQEIISQAKVPVEPTIAASPVSTSEQGRRRHTHKEPATPAPIVETPVPLIEAAASTGEIAPEDLPPLEYSELQKASNSRRRRRHRSSAPTITGAIATTVNEPAAPVLPTPSSPLISSQAPSMPQVLQVPPAPIQAPAASYQNALPQNPLPQNAAANNAYNIVSGYTLNQMNQGSEIVGPFMGPEPSPARGSVITRDGRTTRAESQRSPVVPPVSSFSSRAAEHTLHGPSTASMTQFANIVSQAIQTQTDRMVAELRRANQAPTNVSVNLPPFPSTERVGVFVDVANLLYSARTLRIAVDFGKLLDFLRGNRRLVRAHAYCPTSPQPGDEQMFLQAVKGLGYRITTKNYKTFSSGAKKADLDLDLCMDVVRLVDGRAVDCVILVSGDSDFMPMLDYCSDHGVRVEVAAFDEAMSATLRQSCDLFVNLSMLEEIRS